MRNILKTHTKAFFFPPSPFLRDAVCTSELGYELLQLLFSRSAFPFQAPHKQHEHKKRAERNLFIIFVTNASTLSTWWWLKIIYPRGKESGIWYSNEKALTYVVMCASADPFSHPSALPSLWLIYRIFHVKLYILSVPFSVRFWRVMCLHWWWWKWCRYLHRIWQQGAHRREGGYLRLWLFKYWFD